MPFQAAKKFVGRKRELGQLGKLLDSPRPGIAVIYGRRRVGKTELIAQALRNRAALYFEGLEGEKKPKQIQNFLFQLRNQTGIEHKGAALKSWREVFYLLQPWLEKNPSVIVLDEFQWTANYRREIVSELKMIWDQYWSKIEGVKMIVCGSIASFMKERVVKSTALYGRAEVIVHLKALTLPDAREILSGFGKAEVLTAQMLVGGIPQYLAMLGEYPSVLLAMEELAFTEDGYFTNEFDRIFVSHFGKNDDYERLVRTLSRNSYGLFRKELAEKSGIEGGGRLGEHLSNLEAAGFISSYTPVDKPPTSRVIKYELTDPYLRFYFAFILPNLKKLGAKASGHFFERVANSSAYQSWLGRAFEYVIRDHAVEISRLLGFSGIDFSCGPYFRAKRGSRKGIQIDLVFDRADSVITLCEMKYHRRKIGASAIPEITARVEDLQACFPNKTIQSLLITMNGITREVESAQIPSRHLSAFDLF